MWNSTKIVFNFVYLLITCVLWINQTVFLKAPSTPATMSPKTASLSPKPATIKPRHCRQNPRHCRRKPRHCRRNRRHCRQKRQQYRSYFVEATARLQPRRHATPTGFCIFLGGTKVWVWGRKYPVASKGRTLVRVWGTVSQKLNHFDMCIALFCP